MDLLCCDLLWRKWRCPPLLYLLGTDDALSPTGSSDRLYCWHTRCELGVSTIWLQCVASPDSGFTHYSIFDKLITFSPSLDYIYTPKVALTASPSPKHLAYGERAVSLHVSFWTWCSAGMITLSWNILAPTYYPHRTKIPEKSLYWMNWQIINAFIWRCFHCSHVPSIKAISVSASCDCRHA